MGGLLTSGNNADGAYSLQPVSRSTNFTAQLYCFKAARKKPGSSVSIVSGYGLDDWAIEIRSPVEAKGFFL
jgi:hypothetical protein